MLNTSLKKFKYLHKKKLDQIIYHSLKSHTDKEINNLINNFLVEKNSFIFESVEKGKIKGRYTIFGRNPDKVWEFNNNNSYYIYNNKKKKIRGKPKKIIESIIYIFIDFINTC